MRRYLMLCMEVREDIDTDALVDEVTELVSEADLGRHKPDPDGDEQGITVVLNIPAERQGEFNSTLRQLDMDELKRPVPTATAAT